MSFAYQPVKKLKLSFEEWDKVENFSPNNFFELALEMQALHKAKRYSIENEIRVLFRKDKETYKENDWISIYQDINSQQEVKYFNKIFLKGRHDFLTPENIKK